jgi:hypothetical protein
MYQPPFCNEIKETSTSTLCQIKDGDKCSNYNPISSRTDPWTPYGINSIGNNLCSRS